MSSKQTCIRKYGKQSKKPKSNRLFAELPQTPVRTHIDPAKRVDHDNATEKSPMDELANKISTINIVDEDCRPADSPRRSPRRKTQTQHVLDSPYIEPVKINTPREVLGPPASEKVEDQEESEESEELEELEQPQTPEKVEPRGELQVLSWSEICPPGDRIVKIAEASYAEVYRVSNERGTSIIKVIRMESPIKPQTKAQQKSGLVDEEPHSESDLIGELKISELLADIPGFVVYKERYIVQGKTCRELLETHQTFHKKVKRQDPDRLQFYPSPSRYLDDTKFLVVELGDAGIALEDFHLESAHQLWDIFFHVAIALARAEAHIEFEHRDLHEGNLCIRKVGEPTSPEDGEGSTHFGFSGLEITILDYGLSRAHADYETQGSLPIAYDLERDLSIFTSEHAPQCEVYRRMRSFLLRGDRVCLPPQSHKKSYEEGVDGPITWSQHEPYTNVLWLAYIYQWMITHFKGLKKELNAFKRHTKELWTYLNPDADESVPSFGSASDIVRFALEAGWIEEGQLIGAREEIEKSILSILAHDDTGKALEESYMESSIRRSPRRRQRKAA